MSISTLSPSTAEVSNIDVLARKPLSFVIGLSLLWLVASGLLSLLNLLQLHSPQFLADCSFFTFGRLQALAQTALVYGWTVNAGIAVVLWLLARLGGAPLRGGNYLVVGAVFWNIGVIAGCVGIGLGDMSSFAFLQLPRYVLPLMFFSFAAMAAPGVLAWTGRRKRATFASQWYGVAALFLLPWILSVAMLMLFNHPMRGVMNSVVASWYAQNLFSLWLAPIGLAALYYLLPKISGRVIPSYEFAVFGFWALLLFGTWLAGRTLIAGPVPVWVPTLAVVAGFLLLFHYLVVAVNLRGAFCPQGNVSLQFAAFGLISYLLAGLAGVLFSTRHLAAYVQFTLFGRAQAQLGLAAASVLLFAALYYLLPRLAGKAWPSRALLRAHLWLVVIGVSVLVLALAIGGWRQGHDLNQADVTFATITAHLAPWLLLAVAGQAVLLLGNFLLLVHFFKLVSAKSTAEAAAAFRQPPALEASVS